MAQNVTAPLFFCSLHSQITSSIHSLFCGATPSLFAFVV